MPELVHEFKRAFDTGEMRGKLSFISQLFGTMWALHENVGHPEGAGRYRYNEIWTLET